MKPDVEQETELRHYLLGDLPLQEQVLIEQRLFFDSAYAELAQVIEDDLIDDYLHGDLVASEREKFEHHFLDSPDHKADLRIAEALKENLDAEDSRVISPLNLVEEQQAPPVVVPPNKFFLTSLVKNKPAVWLALAATVLIILSIIAWIAIQSALSGKIQQYEAKDPQPAQTLPDNQQLPTPTPLGNGPGDQKKQTVEQRNNNREKGKLPDKPRETPLQPIFATILPGNSSRGAGQTKILPSSFTSEQVTLRLPLIAAKRYRQYRYELLRADSTIQTGDLKLQSDKEWGRVVLITIPAELLTKQSYQIKLRGRASDGTSSEETIYPFTVQ